jgi:hypothetical protein
MDCLVILGLFAILNGTGVLYVHYCNLEFGTFYSGDQSGNLKWVALCYYGKYSRTLVADLEGR